MVVVDTAGTLVREEVQATESWPFNSSTAPLHWQGDRGARAAALGQLPNAAWALTISIR